MRHCPKIIGLALGAAPNAITGALKTGLFTHLLVTESTARKNFWRNDIKCFLRLSGAFVPDRRIIFEHFVFENAVGLNKSCF